MLSETVSLWFGCKMKMEEQGRGGEGEGDRKNRGRDGFRRRQRDGRKVGVLKGWGKGGNRGKIMQQRLIFRSLKGIKRGSREKRGGSWDYVLEAGGLDAPVPHLNK